MTKKKWLTIVIVVLSSIFIFVMLYAVGCRVSCTGIRCKSSLNNERCLEITDITTGEIYTVWQDGHNHIHFPYDGLEHKFTYKLKRNRDGKKFDSGTVMNTGKPIIERGTYRLSVIAMHKKDPEQYVFYIDIQEPTPMMQFDSNGAIEFEDKKYYKYKYTGQVCCPMVFVDAGKDGIKTARIQKCRRLGNKVQYVKEPVEIGRYECYFEILHDEHVGTHFSGPITIEIVK